MITLASSLEGCIGNGSFPSGLTRLKKPLAETQLATLRNSFACNHMNGGVSQLVVKVPEQQPNTTFRLVPLSYFPTENAEETCTEKVGALINNIQASTNGQITTVQNQPLFFGTTTDPKTGQPLLTLVIQNQFIPLP